MPDINFTFIEKEDLETSVFETYLDESIQEDIDAIEKIELQVIALVRSRLRKRYDVAIIFSDAPYTNRELIIWAVAGLVTCRIIRRNAARKVPDDFKENCKTIMDWLIDVRDEIESPDLPLIENPDQKEVLWGNNTNEDLYL